MKQKKLKLELRFILVIIAVCLLCFSLLGVVSYRVISKIMINQNQEDAMGIAATAAGQIDGDSFASISSTQQDEYRQVYKILTDYKVNNLISYIYAMKEDGDQLLFVVDTDEEAPAEFLEEYEYLEDIKPAFAGQVCCDQAISSDKWGSYFSSYAPIFNSNGEVVGIVGCDITMESINAILRKLVERIIIIIVVFNAILVLAYIALSRIVMGRDILTEIPNYDSLIKKGNKLKKQKTLFSYTGILINIKDFKYMSQKVGAKDVDQILREYARFLLTVKERKDFIATTGSDNFFMLVKKSREQEVLKRIKKTELVVWVKGNPVVVPVEARAGLYHIKNEDDINLVLNACTFALNKAKVSNSSNYLWFEDDMFEQMNQEKELLSAFKNGMERQEFVVYYQPKVNIFTNRLCGAEALVRWLHDGKLVPPNNFIPILEKNNLITELDFYVLNQVCRDIKRWQKEKKDVVKISTNFSKLHLINPNFAQDILKVLKTYNIDPGFIETELTESSGYYDLEALTRFVDCMNASNVSVSIDDFGTGYSSLSLLKDLKVNVVKVDKSFFRDMETKDKINEKMIENVIRMIQDLGKEVISEGIETYQQVAFLRQINSPIVQGFIFDKPLKCVEFEEKLMNPEYHLESI